MPVSLLLVVPNMLVVNPAFLAQSVKGTGRAGEVKPGQFSFASSGNGSAQHLAAELFKAQAGLSWCASRIAAAGRRWWT